MGTSLLCFFTSIYAQETITDVSRNEIAKRQNFVSASDKLLQAGLAAQSQQSFGEAMNHFRSAFETLPDVPIYSNRRRTIFRHYQSASLQFARDSIESARWQDAKDALEKAIKSGEDAGFNSPVDPSLHQLLRNLKDPGYYPAATLTPQHLQNIETVKQFLIAAQAYVDYGNYDQAVDYYNKVLTIDPYNKAARRGMENVERHKIKYYQVARDHARAKAIRQVEQEWECEVPLGIYNNPNIEIPNRRTEQSQRANLEFKLKNIIIPSIALEEVPLENAVDLLRRRSVQFDVNEPDITKKGLSFLIDTGSFESGTNVGQRPVTLKLTNVSLYDLLKTVCRQSQTTFKIDSFAVSIISLTAGERSTLELRQWIVPPSFLNRENLLKDSISNDPFASGATSTSRLNLQVQTAKEFLQESGVTFGPGTLANYDRNSNTLGVRNTREQLELVDSLVQSARASANMQVRIEVKIITISQEDAEERGLDWLLGPGSVGSNERFAIGGGTDGNSTNPLINTSNPVSPFSTNNFFPVTSGLRSANVSSGDNIDNLLQNSGNQTTATDTPANFAVAGILTDPQFQLILRNFKQSKGTDFLCATELLVQPGQRGLIEIIREFPYPTEYDPPEIPNNTNNFFVGNQSGIVTPANPTAFEVRNLGKTVEVAPTVGPNNQLINLDLNVEFSEFLGFIDYGSPIQVPTPATGLGGGIVTGQIQNQVLMPVFDTIRETTNVSAYDGQTIAIGGLFGHRVTDIQDKIPFAGDLPLLGLLGRNASEVHEKTMLSIFLTVRLVDPGSQPINAANTSIEDPNYAPQIESQLPQQLPQQQLPASFLKDRIGSSPK